MSLWIAEPRDTLVIRDAKHEFSGMGARRSLTMPYPSTTAGLARTRIGSDAGGIFTMSVPEARAIPVCGPWLARLGANDEVDQWLFPTPADALWFPAEEGLARYRLSPETPPAGVQTSSKLPRAPRPATALPAGKPAERPALITGKALQSWLVAPEASGVVPATHLAEHMREELRTHVAIEGQGRTAKEGALFSEVQRRFVTEARTRHAVGFRCADPRLQPGLVQLGGERRLSSLRRSAEPLLPETQLSGGLLRVILLTPAIFADGYLPQEAKIAGATVVAACVGRPVPISGWDFEKRGAKAIRRMAPAGSVYWVDAPEGWANAQHLNCISDDPQDRLDGFGLCAVGVG